MIKLWYNSEMDPETPLYYIYNDNVRIGWIKNVDEDGYIDSILIYKKYRNLGYGKKAILALKELEKRELSLDVKKDNVQAIKCYASIGFEPCLSLHQSRKEYMGMRLK